MIDLHSHLLYDTDDGTVDINQSVELIKSAYNNGYNSLVLTPHYIEGSIYQSDVLSNTKKIELIKSKCLKKGIDINLYLGNETYLSKNLLKLLEQKKITTINDSKYLLLELPMVSENKNTLDIIKTLVENGIIPIIAHPERYHYIIDNINKAFDLVQSGALLQVNIGSLIGVFGKQSKKTALKLLKLNIVHFISSDTHHSDLYSKVEETKKIINRINPSLVDELMHYNAKQVLENKEIKKRVKVYE